MAEPDTKELDALLDSLNGSAERFQTLWFSFLGLTVYFAIAALATTHRNLLLGEPQILPILNIKVELLAFYVIAPLLYLVFHFYVLMMLMLLARTAASFEQQLRTTLPGDAKQEKYRARADNALFLQLLIGMKEERAGVNSYLLAAIALITIVIAPLATLILIQMMFLPYHSFAITWWHRALVIVDLGIVLVMWRRFFHDSSNPLLLFRDWPRLRECLSFAASLALLYVVLWLSLGEGRWAGEDRVLRADLAASEKGVVFGLFPDRLILRNEVIVGEKPLRDTKKETPPRGAGFLHTRSLDGIPTLQFEGRDLQAAILVGADLRGVSLNETNMRGAQLQFAHLEGALLVSANLQGADLADAHLRGANLNGAQLQGADLDEAELQGAYFLPVNYPGARVAVVVVHLEGADLSNAQLEGADLRRAELQGADLSDAQLEGADLSEAQLEGVDLSNAQLQGADLRGADTADSEFDGAFVFRTDATSANLSTCMVRSIRTDGYRLAFFPVLSVLPLAEDDIDEWRAAATQFATDEMVKADKVQHFERLKAELAGDQDEARQVTWTGMEEASLALDPGGAQHQRRLATILGDLACEPEFAPYVARALVGQHSPPHSRLAALGDEQLNRVRNRMQEGRTSPTKCPGVTGFSDGDWQELKAIKPVPFPNALWKLIPTGSSTLSVARAYSP